MPVRNGRWINPSVVLAEEAALRAAEVARATEPPEAAQARSEPKARKPRSNKAAAAAAIADATGVDVTIDQSAETDEEETE